MRYTLRNVPQAVDRALRERARSQGKALNEVVIETLQRALGLAGETPVQRDLTDIVGTWQSDPEMDRILGEHRRIDPELWR
jgi:plasmid stability protein